MNQDFEKGDLETVHYYFAACAQCGRATIDRPDWPDAIADAETLGYQIDGGVIYCDICAEVERERHREEQAYEEARHAEWSREDHNAS